MMCLHRQIRDKILKFIRQHKGPRPPEFSEIVFPLMQNISEAVAALPREYQASAWGDVRGLANAIQNGETEFEFGGTVRKVSH